MEKKLLLKRWFWISLGILTLVAIVILASLSVERLPTQEEARLLLASWGAWGYVVYVVYGLVATVIVPVNFSIAGIAGGYVYGLTTAFLINWVIRTIGNFISFLLGRYFSKHVFKYFPQSTQDKYMAIAQSEMAVVTYFILSLFPFTPSDFIPYFLGVTKMKKRVFLMIDFFGNIGTSFGLAYIGSGQAFDNPLIFLAMIAIMGTGLTWLHHNKKKFGLT